MLTTTLRARSASIQRLDGRACPVHQIDSMATDLRLPTDRIVRPDKDRFLNEENPFEAMMSRFDRAADLLDLEPGLYKVLRHPEKQIIVSVPVLLDNGEVEVYTGLSRAVQHVARAGEGRHSIRPERHARRGEGARRVDDVEVRGGEPAVRRGEGWRRLRSAQDERRRARAADAALHRRHHRDARSRLGRSGAGRQHERARDGVGDGHVLHARTAHGDRRRDRASRSRWAARSAAAKRPGAGA